MLFCKATGFENALAGMYPLVRLSDELSKIGA